MHLSWKHMLREKDKDKDKYMFTPDASIVEAYAEGGKYFQEFLEKIQ